MLKRREFVTLLGSVEAQFAAAKRVNDVRLSIARTLKSRRAMTDPDDAGIDRGLILEIDMGGADGMIFGDGNPPPTTRLAQPLAGCFVRADFLTRLYLQVGSMNQTSRSAQDCCTVGWFNLTSSLVIIARAVARAAGTLGPIAIASVTNATAVSVTAIRLYMSTLWRVRN